AEREPELDHGDRDRGSHADDDGRRVEHVGDARDGGEHPPDEGVDDLEPGDVDDHAACARLRDPVGEVLLELQGGVVLEVDLDRDEERRADLEDGDGVGHAGSPARRVSRPERSASTSASARLARVRMSPNSMPSATIVCAICGRMPLIVHSAPMRRAATTVLSRCCATWVSTAGTPVMSMIACSLPVSTSVLSSFSMTTWVRAE